MLQCSLAECLPPCTATPTSCAVQFEKAFPNKDAQLCVGCLSGKRSIAACNILQVCGTALRLAAHLLLRTLHALPLVAVLPRLRLPALDPRHHCAKLAAAASAPLKRLLALTSKQHHAAPCCLVASSDLIGLSSDFSFPLLPPGCWLLQPHQCGRRVPRYGATTDTRQMRPLPACSPTPFSPIATVDAGCMRRQRNWHLRCIAAALWLLPRLSIAACRCRCCRCHSPTEPPCCLCAAAWIGAGLPVES